MSSQITSPEEFTTVELFAGVGGFGLAVESCGGKIATQVEIDKNCQSVLNYHWSDVPKIGDIHDATKENLPAARFVCGGSPCQSFSIPGKQDGFAGASQLWFEFHRILTELRPRFFLWENVPGVFSSSPLLDDSGKKLKGLDFAVILAGFTGYVYPVPKNGWRTSGLVRGNFYNIAWRTFDSQYAGVPQRRRRVFAAGCLASTGIDPSEILFERQGMSWNSPTRRRKRESVTPTTQSGTSGGGEGNSEITPGVFIMRRSDSYAPTNVASTLSARQFKSATDLVTSAFNLTFCDSNGRRKDRLKGGLYVNETEQANTLSTRKPVEQTLIVTQKKNEHHKKNKFRSSVYPVGVRRFTPLECERLQAFPDDWTRYGTDGKTVFELSDSVRYRMMGNAVTVSVIAWIVRRIMEIDRQYTESQRV